MPALVFFFIGPEERRTIIYQLVFYAFIVFLVSDYACLVEFGAVQVYEVSLFLGRGRWTRDPHLA
jgi:hypothetical protein